MHLKERWWGGSNVLYVLAYSLGLRNQETQQISARLERLIFFVFVMKTFTSLMGQQPPTR